MNSIEGISEIFYDIQDVSLFDRGTPRFMWVSYSGGRIMSYLSLHRDKTYLKKPELEEIRNQLGYSNGEFISLGEAWGLHFELWVNPEPVLLIYDMCRYKVGVAKSSGHVGGKHLFLIQNVIGNGDEHLGFIHLLH